MTETILVADDDASVLAALRMMLKSHNYDVVAVTTPEALLEQVKSKDFSAALIDLNYQSDTTSGEEGLALIKQIKTIDESLPIIVMTGYSSVEIAVEAMKLGASDFVQKPWGNERLLHVIQTQIQLKNACKKGSKLAQENALLKDQLNAASMPIVAQSAAMKALLAKLTKLALSDMSILLTGENGTGKSLLAEFVHDHSPRSDSPFISVNMGAIPESLFESEMFGHVKGAFTDAKSMRIGRFELAESGTIFLDEIANVPMTQQSKLLRVLEARQFEKVGSSKTQDVDVRLVSATNADLTAMLENNEFRQDLLFRLNTVTLEVPPLRERTADILPLAQNFMRQFADKYQIVEGQLSEEAITAMTQYPWPGNIRELAHVIERAMFLRTDETIETNDLSLTSRQPQDSKTDADWQHMTLDDIEKQVIKARLADLNNQPLEVAESLGLSRSAYYRRLEKYDITP